MKALLFSQIPTLASGELERWLLSAAAAGSVFLLFKKLVPRKPQHQDFVTKAEFNTELNGLRDKIDARFLALGEKIERLGESLHQRLNEMEAGLARVDERTRK